MRVAAALTVGASAPGTASDPRIRVVVYSPTDVVSVQGHYGYQMLIAFAPDEHIGNISIGDSTAWAVTPNKEDNGLFLKPVAPRAATNMTVQTERRTYLFELAAARPGHGGTTDGMLYKLQFRYPEPPAPRPPAPVTYNRAYKISGTKTLLPTQVFDDGHATYFNWPNAVPIPAIFVIDGNEEQLVNPSLRDGYVIVDRVATSFLLRAGREKARIVNKAGPASVPPGLRKAAS